MKIIRRFLNVILIILCLIVSVFGMAIEAVVRVVASVSVCVIWYICTGHYPVLFEDRDKFVIGRVVEWVLDKGIYDEFN